ncbi:MAG: orotate phosphoribosyltransferase [Thermoleophilia bacterium]|nr:orotate phosphoribosyltransferase [Thermoleophilia bacterium]
MSDSEAVRARLIELLKEHSLVLGGVTLSSGAEASYYIDARRTVMRPEGLKTAGILIAGRAKEVRATAVGGPVMAAIPLACAAIAAPEGEDLVGFFVRKERKAHGLQRWVEGGAEPGDRVLVVEDTVTTGGSTVSAIERIRDEGFEIAAVLSLVDRLAGGGEKIAAAADAPYTALTTIAEIYPDRPRA